MRILIGWADDASPNLGVRALGRGSQELLSGLVDHVEFTWMNYGARPPAVPWGPRALVRERLTGRSSMMAWLRSFDVLWDTRSGDSFADIYGLDRHVTMSLIYEFAAQAGVRTILAPQTIGPFGTRTGRVLARRNLKRSSLVFARDPLSANAALELGRPVDATTTDMVFAISQPTVRDPHDVVLNVSGLLWQDNRHLSAEAYQTITRRLIDRLLSEGRHVTVMPHVLSSSNPDNDVPVSQALVNEYGGRIDLEIPSDLEDARALLASASVVIGSRMHACLNALSTGTPGIALAYSRKFRPLLAELGWGHVLDVDPRSPQTTVDCILAAVNDTSLTQQALDAQAQGQARIAELRRRVGALL